VQVGIGTVRSDDVRWNVTATALALYSSTALIVCYNLAALALLERHSLESGVTVQITMTKKKGTNCVLGRTDGRTDGRAVQYVQYVSSLRPFSVRSY
jgi:hypothetical protein